MTVSGEPTSASSNAPIVMPDGIGEAREPTEKSAGGCRARADFVDGERTSVVVSPKPTALSRQMCDRGQNFDVFLSSAAEYTQTVFPVLVRN